MKVVTLVLFLNYWVAYFFGFCILITSLGFPFETISFDSESEIYVLYSCVSFVYYVIDFGILVFMESVSDEPFFLGSFMTISITWGFS